MNEHPDDMNVFAEFVEEAGLDETLGILGELNVEFDVEPVDVPVDDLATAGLDGHSLDFGDPVGDLVYGGEQDLDELATDLWDRIGPGGPPPVGENGQPLSPGELLAELRFHTDDALTRSVIDRSIVQWERQHDDWSQHLGPDA